jgi:hypothetical protein
MNHHPKLKFTPRGRFGIQKKGAKLHAALQMTGRPSNGRTLLRGLQYLNFFSSDVRYDTFYMYSSDGWPADRIVINELADVLEVQYVVEFTAIENWMSEAMKAREEHLVVKYDNQTANWLTEYPKGSPTYFRWNAIVRMAYRMFLCGLARQRYQLETGVTYDFVVRTRADLGHHPRFERVSRVPVPQCFTEKARPNEYVGQFDQIAVGTAETIDIENRFGNLSEPFSIIRDYLLDRSPYQAKLDAQRTWHGYNKSTYGLLALVFSPEIQLRMYLRSNDLDVRETPSRDRPEERWHGDMSRPFLSWYQHYLRQGDYRPGNIEPGLESMERPVSPCVEFSAQLQAFTALLAARRRPHQMWEEQLDPAAHSRFRHDSIAEPGEFFSYMEPLIPPLMHPSVCAACGNASDATTCSAAADRRDHVIFTQWDADAMQLESDNGGTATVYDMNAEATPWLKKELQAMSVNLAAAHVALNWVGRADVVIKAMDKEPFWADIRSKRVRDYNMIVLDTPHMDLNFFVARYIVEHGDLVERVKNIIIRVGYRASGVPGREADRPLKEVFEVLLRLRRAGIIVHAV